MMIKKRSVTLVEVVVSSLILALVFSSLLSSFMSARKYVGRANKRLVSVNLARQVINKLYGEVRADWDSRGRLDVNLHPREVSVTIDGREYSGRYMVTTISSNGADRDYRQVTVEVDYLK